MAANLQMQSEKSRIDSFLIPHQLGKRRASSQAGRKKGATTVEWPHQNPSPDDLARAGFFYKPSPDSLDNVQCFFCDVKLDGWEATDIPLQEHIAHRADCEYALCLHVGALARAVGQNASIELDPMSEELQAARRGTFEHGRPWPHEGKKGWKCKISKLVAAGWCFTPSLDEDADDVTCFYCDLGLDGWEPKDDPLQEHKRRSPDCAFFRLLGTTVSTGVKKAKGKGKGARSSSISRASRQSVQSIFSTLSDRWTEAELDMGLPKDAYNDNTINETTDLKPATSSKGVVKKSGTKTTKGKKRPGTIDHDIEMEPLYPDLGEIQASDLTSSRTALEAKKKQLPHSKRAASRPSEESTTSALDSRNSVTQPVPKKNCSRSKAKVMPEQTTDRADLDQSEVSAQLNVELDRSLSIDLEDRFEQGDSALRSPSPTLDIPRGTKRTSDGVIKQQRESSDDLKIGGLQFPHPGKTTKLNRKISQLNNTKSATTTSLAAQASESEKFLSSTTDRESLDSTQDIKKKQKVSKGRSSSTKRTLKSSKPKSKTSQLNTAADRSGDLWQESRLRDEEDLEQDEREIDAELERIAAEQSAAANLDAVEKETDAVLEFEPSPSSQRAAAQQTNNVDEHVHAIQDLEIELQAELDDGAVVRRDFQTDFGKLARSSLPRSNRISKVLTPSPNGSDKENMPSSRQQPQGTTPSPTKTTRVPLAMGTPHRALQSPAKHLTHQVSTVPWQAIDLDSILFGSGPGGVVSTPGGFPARLAGAAGLLDSPEKRLTVEQWVRTQAERGEMELRKRCEEMVLTFEREGNRAMASLGGLVIAERP